MVRTDSQAAGLNDENLRESVSAYGNSLKA